MARLFLILKDLEELGYYVAAELADTWLADHVGSDVGSLCTEGEALWLHPEAMEAWRRGDDTVAHRSQAIIEAVEDALQAVAHEGDAERGAG